MGVAKKKSLGLKKSWSVCGYYFMPVLNNFNHVIQFLLPINFCIFLLFTFIILITQCFLFSWDYFVVPLIGLGSVVSCGTKNKRHKNKYHSVAISQLLDQVADHGHPIMATDQRLYKHENKHNVL